PTRPQPTPRGASGAAPTAEPTAEPAAGAEVEIPAGAPRTPFDVASVTADSACTNDTIGGEVLDAAGAPVAGIRIIGVDQWGSFIEATTQSDANAGRFSVPIGSDAREYYLTVVDETGAPLSFTVTVQHRLEGQPQNRCHTIVWQAR
ncbi:MAG: hypothetical protein ACRC1H_19150, partial [Caldilineaceae bacterium]